MREPLDDNQALIAACVAFRAGELPVDQLLGTVSEVRLYLCRPLRPGVFVVTAPGHWRWAVVYSSPAGLATSLPHGGGWYSAAGKDVLELLPGDVGLLVDPNAEHCVALMPEWIRQDGGDVDRVLR